MLSFKISFLVLCLVLLAAIPGHGFKRGRHHRVRTEAASTLEPDEPPFRSPLHKEAANVTAGQVQSEHPLLEGQKTREEHTVTPEGEGTTRITATAETSFHGVTVVTSSTQATGDQGHETTLRPPENAISTTYIRNNTTFFPDTASHVLRSENETDPPVPEEILKNTSLSENVTTIKLKQQDMKQQVSQNRAVRSNQTKSASRYTTVPSILDYIINSSTTMDSTLPQNADAEGRETQPNNASSVAESRINLVKLPVPKLANNRKTPASAASGLNESRMNRDMVVQSNTDNEKGVSRKQQREHNRRERARQRQRQWAAEEGRINEDDGEPLRSRGRNRKVHPLSRPRIHSKAKEGDDQKGQRQTKDETTLTQNSKLIDTREDYNVRNSNDVQAEEKKSWYNARAIPTEEASIQGQPLTTGVTENRTTENRNFGIENLRSPPEIRMLENGPFNFKISDEKYMVDKLNETHKLDEESVRPHRRRNRNRGHRRRNRKKSNHSFGEEQEAVTEFQSVLIKNNFEDALVNEGHGKNTPAGQANLQIKDEEILKESGQRSRHRGRRKGANRRRNTAAPPQSVQQVDWATPTMMTTSETSAASDDPTPLEQSDDVQMEEEILKESGQRPRNRDRRKGANRRRNTVAPPQSVQQVDWEIATMMTTVEPSGESDDPTPSEQSDDVQFEEVTLKESGERSRNRGRRKGANRRRNTGVPPQALTQVDWATPTMMTTIVVSSAASEGPISSEPSRDLQKKEEEILKLSDRRSRNRGRRKGANRRRSTVTPSQSVTRVDWVASTLMTKLETSALASDTSTPSEPSGDSQLKEEEILKVSSQRSRNRGRRKGANRKNTAIPPQSLVQVDWIASTMMTTIETLAASDGSIPREQSDDVQMVEELLKEYGQISRNIGRRKGANRRRNTAAPHQSVTQVDWATPMMMTTFETSAASEGPTPPEQLEDVQMEEEILKENNHRYRNRGRRKGANRRRNPAAPLQPVQQVDWATSTVMTTIDASDGLRNPPPSGPRENKRPAYREVPLMPRSDDVTDRDLGVDVGHGHHHHRRRNHNRYVHRRRPSRRYGDVDGLEPGLVNRENRDLDLTLQASRKKRGVDLTRQASKKVTLEAFPTKSDMDLPLQASRKERDQDLILQAYHMNRDLNSTLYGSKKERDLHLTLPVSYTTSDQPESSEWHITLERRCIICIGGSNCTRMELKMCSKLGQKKMSDLASLKLYAYLFSILILASLTLLFYNDLYKRFMVLTVILGVICIVDVTAILFVLTMRDF